MGPARLQVAAGFSWDVGLSSLKPAAAAQDGDSSDEEDQHRDSKVRQTQMQNFLTLYGAQGKVFRIQDLFVFPLLFTTHPLACL